MRTTLTTQAAIDDALYSGIAAGDRHLIQEALYAAIEERARINRLTHQGLTPELDTLIKDAREALDLTAK